MDRWGRSLAAGFHLRLWWIVVLAAQIIAASAAWAQDATWALDPTVIRLTILGVTTYDYNSSVDWTPTTVPTGTATFGASNGTFITFSADATLNGWTFTAAAPNYSFLIFSNELHTVTFNGAGVVMNGASTVTFDLWNTGVGTSKVIFNNSSSAADTPNTLQMGYDGLGELDFNDSSTAGKAVIQTYINFNDNSTAGNAILLDGLVLMNFNDNSTAGNATLYSIVNSFNFYDHSSAGNATISPVPGCACGGLAWFYDYSTADHANITVDNDNQSFSDVVLAFNAHSTADHATITNINGGEIYFQYDSTAGDATISNDSLLIFNGNATAGNATITTKSNGSTFFYSTFYGSPTGGQAQFITEAGGVVDFSGTNGPANDNKLTAGSLAGGGNYYLGANELTVGGNDMSTEVSGVISDCGTGGTACLNSGAIGGSLVKTGTGTLTLSGTNTYTGPTTVKSGTLIVNGSIASSSMTTVNAGATLGGSGTIGTTVINGGTLALGSSPGIKTIQGNLTFTSTSTYLINVTPTKADLTNVTGVSGQATLAGTVQAVFQPGNYMVRNYTILHADGGLNGTTFDNLTTNMPNFTAELDYTANDVLLNLTSVLGALPGDNLNRNQQQVAATLNDYFNDGGALPPTFVDVFNLTGAPLGNALSQLSGEVGTGAQQAAFQSQQYFLDLMLDPFVSMRDAAAAGPALAFAGTPAASASRLPPEVARAYAEAMPVKAATMTPFERRWTAWAAGYGGSATADGDATVGSHDTDTRAAGIAAGVDYRLSSDTVFGFAVAGGNTHWSLADGLGSGHSDLFQAGAYGSHRLGPAYVSAAMAYAWHQASTTRTVTASGSETLDGHFHPHVLGFRFEAGYRFGNARFGLTPYAAGQVQMFHSAGYNETATSGASAFALSYDSQTTTTQRSELGLWADYHVLGPQTNIVLRARAAWLHNSDTGRRLTAGFPTLAGTSFTVDGAARDANMALVSAAADFTLRPGVSLMAKFDGEFGGHTRSYAGTGTLRVSW